MTGFAVVIIDADYSPDVELDLVGNLVFARNVPSGEVVRIPRHLFDRLIAKPWPASLPLPQ